jgi:hypothetical protein
MTKWTVRHNWRHVISGGILAATAVAALWYISNIKRRIRLFDNMDRQDHSPRPYAQPDFVYLNASARPGVEAIRATLEDWFSRYPKAGRAELRSRFRSNNLDHRSAYFELFLHELLLRLGCKVELHPQIPGTTRRPDFAVLSDDNQRFYVEAVLASDQSEEEMAAEARKNQVYDALNRLDSPNFYIGMDLRGAPATPPSARKLRAFIGKQLAQLNPDELEVQFQSGGIPALPHWSYEHDGWAIEFFPIPKSDRVRGKSGARPIGVQLEGGRFLSTKLAIREAISGKAGRYGRLPGPYFIAVNVLSDHVDEIDSTEALFGDEQLVYTTGLPLPQEPRLQRAANGIWRGPDGPRNTRVSGVLIFEQLTQSNIPRVTSRLYVNPWAAAPYSGPLDRLPLATVVDNKMKYLEGQGLAMLFGLPNDWPSD